MAKHDPENEKQILDEYAKKYEPLITVVEAATIARVPKATIHSWSSSGRLDPFKKKVGRHILLLRDEFVRFILAGNSDHSRETLGANV